VNTSTTRTATFRNHSALFALALFLPMIVLPSTRRTFRHCLTSSVLAISLAVVVLSSCGGGGGGGNTSAPPPTSTTTLTPVGSYNVLVTGTSRSLTRTISLQVVVQ
jgi:multidrug efflux pump subunit AcrA (membrane-fusion protein)